MPRPNPRRNISRVEIESSSGKTNGTWQVRFSRKGKIASKCFADSVFGGKAAALRAAKEFRDEMEHELPNYTTAELAKSPSVRNSSGVVGVRRSVMHDVRGEYQYTYEFWIAQWTDGKGRRRTKSFSINKYGEAKAQQLALKARRKGIKQSQVG